MTNRDSSGDDGLWSVYDAPATDDITREARDADGPARSGRTRWPLFAGALVALAGGAIGVVVALTGGEVGGGPDQLPEEAGYEPIMDERTLDDVAAHLEAATGSTDVLEFRAYGTDEVMIWAVPEAEDELAEVYEWDGSTFELSRAERTRHEQSFDLRDIDVPALVAVDEYARQESNGPISYSRVHVSRPDGDDDWIYVNVTETDRDGFSVWAELDGTVTGTFATER